MAAVWVEGKKTKRKIRNTQRKFTGRKNFKNKNNNNNKLGVKKSFQTKKTRSRRSRRRTWFVIKSQTLDKIYASIGATKLQNQNGHLHNQNRHETVYTTSNSDLVNMMIGIVRRPPNGATMEEALRDVMNWHGAKISHELVEDVLKHLYKKGNNALRFLEWVLEDNTMPSSTWNWVMYLLASSKETEGISKFIQFMGSRKRVNIETFAIIFEFYCCARKRQEAFKAFDSMGDYEVCQNTLALNCLVGSLCKYNQVAHAEKHVQKWVGKIQPDVDTYTLLMEGWENRKKYTKVQEMFLKMIENIDTLDIEALPYEAMLESLVEIRKVESAFEVLDLLIDKKCSGPGAPKCSMPSADFFNNVLKVLCQREEYLYMLALWDKMKRMGVTPDVYCYHRMVTLYCRRKDFKNAFDLFDEMASAGVSPVFHTYHTVFIALVKNNKVDDASRVFKEMTSKGMYLTLADRFRCLQMYLDAGCFEMAVTIWRGMFGGNRNSIASKCTLRLIKGLCDVGRVAEAMERCEEAIDKGFKVCKKTMSELGCKAFEMGKEEAFQKLQLKLNIKKVAIRDKVMSELEGKDFELGKQEAFRILQSNLNPENGAMREETVSELEGGAFELGKHEASQKLQPNMDLHKEAAREETMSKLEGGAVELGKHAATQNLQPNLNPHKEAVRKEPAPPLRFLHFYPPLL